MSFLRALVVATLALVPLGSYWAVTLAGLPARTAGMSPAAGPASNANATLARVGGALVEADAGARDYVLTDNRQALLRARAAIGRLPDLLAALDAALVDPGVREAFGTLGTLVTEELAVIGQLTGSFLPGSIGPIGEREAIGRSGELLDRLRDVLADIEARLDAAIARDEARRAADDARRFASRLWTSAALGFAGIVLAAAAAAAWRPRERLSAAARRRTSGTP